MVLFVVESFKLLIDTSLLSSVGFSSMIPSLKKSVKNLQELIVSEAKTKNNVKNNLECLVVVSFS